jgi:hypothetical protein
MGKSLGINRSASPKVRIAEEGKRQKVKSKRQKVKSKRQKVKGKRQKVKGTPGNGH